MLNNLTIQTYIVDAFTLYAASGNCLAPLSSYFLPCFPCITLLTDSFSAIAASSCLRSIAGFGFPLFASDMYNALGYGKGNTILAAIAIGIGCPACVSHTRLLHLSIAYLSIRPWIFWFYGERIRLASRHAAKSA